MEKPKPPTSIVKTKIYNQKILNIKTDNIKPFTVELIKANVHKYDFKAFLGGIYKLSKFISNMIVLETKEGQERNFVCTDATRNSFHRLVLSKKDEIISLEPKDLDNSPKDNGTWQMDREALYLNNVFDELRPNIKDYYDRFLVLLNKDDYYIQQSGEMSVIYAGIKGNHDDQIRKDLLTKVRDIDNGVKSIASI
jgi:hypothetical protein